MSSQRPNFQKSNSAANNKKKQGIFLAHSKKNETRKKQKNRKNQENQGQSGNGSSQPTQKEPKTLLVKGLQDVRESEFLNYLRKQIQSLKCHEFRTTDAGVLLTVDHQSALNLLNLKGKFQKQLFQITNARMEDLYTEAQQELFKQFIASRYNPQTKFLDLKGMIAEPNLRNAQINADLKQKHFYPLFAAVMKNIPEVETVDFSGNRLSNLSHLTSLAEIFPNVQNLNFQNNGIKDLKQFDYLKGLKHLRELLIDDNEVCDDMAASQIKKELQQKFPNLTMLNSELLRSFQLPVLEEDDTGLPPSKESFIAENISAVVTDFLQKFFEACDTNRNSLPLFYLEEARFSLSVPKDISNAKSYADFNRNLQVNDIAVVEKRIPLLCKGKREIISTINMLPYTTHLISSMTVDAWEEADPSSCLLVFIHGNFEEERGTIRSFDRHMILVPARPGSPAQTHGLLAEIVSDQLRLRGTEKKISPPPSSVSSSSSSSSSAPSNSMMIQEIMKVTQLKEEFARDLLMHSGFDYEQALKKFLLLKQQGGVPDHYFAGTA